MKTKISILILSCISYFAYSQVDIINSGNVGINSTNPSKRLHVRDNSEIQLLLENSGSDGAGLLLENTNNHRYTLITDYKNYWGHTNTFDIRTNDGHLSFQIYPDYHVNVNSHLVVDYHIYIYNDQTARHHQANGFDFNPNTTNPGLTLEHHGAESSGFYSDNDYAVIWSPGDYGRLLRVYDEDGMNEKWYLDGNGYAHTISDKNKTENIKKIDNSLVKLKSIQGVKFNYKKEDTIAVRNVQNYNADSIWPGDIEYKDTKKYDPTKNQYFGFIAQEVEKIYPDLVSTNEKGDKYISYMEFIPLLVEGV